MKKAIAGIVAVAGVASMAVAATTIQYQVRSVGGVWGSSIDAAPGTQVEFRALVSFTGGTLSQTDAFGDTFTGPALGFGACNLQSTVSNWTASDSLAPFIASGSATASSITDFDGSGSYGRRGFASGNSGVTASNAFKGHTTNVISGVRYLRLAATPTTNWTGVGTNANNMNGAGGIPVAQTGPSANANFQYVTQNVELQRFKITVSGVADRTLTVTTALESMILLSNGSRTVQWHINPNTSVPANDTDITIIPATIHVPTPGALALLGLGGMVAGRRRRA